MAKRWCTKEDVLKDLDEASGRRVPHYIPTQYCLYGEQPPPRIAVEDEDEELELRFGAAASQRMSQEDPGPDLMGITTMLRMVQQYENSSDDEVPLTPNRRIIISKGNSHRSPSGEKTGNNNMKGTYKSPNKRIATNASPKQMVVNGATNSSEGGSGDKITPDNRSTPSDNKIASPVKVINNNGTVISKLNPYVKEFIPKCVQVESTQNSKTTEQNIMPTDVSSGQSNDSGDNKKTAENQLHKTEIMECTDSDIKKSLNNHEDLIKIKQNAAGGMNGDITKEKKKEMAMILKNQISTKNVNFKDQQKTHRAIVNLLKLYAEPRPAKPLKLLTPEFFEKCKAVDNKDSVEGSTKTDRSFERMTSLHNVDKVDLDETPNSSRGVIAGSQGSMLAACGQSDASTMTNDISLFKDEVESEYDDIPPGENDTDNSNKTFNKPYDNNDVNNFKENELEVYKQNVNIQNIEGEDEMTQLTPDMGEISIDETDVTEENETIDPYIEESISKVNNWLHDKPVVTMPEKSKNPSLYLGAVGYKRKDPLTCKSPNEVTGKKVSKPTEYKPSCYAEELHKKYSEKSKIANPTPVLNIWEKLEADLKKKDLEVKTRKKKAK